MSVDGTAEVDVVEVDVDRELAAVVEIELDAVVKVELVAIEEEVVVVELGT